ncbi:MAG TPA: hypothetical protein VGY75_07505 [Candidatus Udaeobacter sp.]|jgi:hypothetical protein|nr:hypothetical protein [Candidatus Udaeobacter sp.]
MKTTGADNQNGSAQAQWPEVTKIASEEFLQTYAVAELAVKLCALKKAQSKVPIEKENLDPKDFLAKAWELIQSAREHVLRPKTNAEYLKSGSDEAAENVTGRILSESRIQFQTLCNNKEIYTEIEFHDADTKTIIKKDWKVYGSEAGFKKLFWRYWNATSVIKDEVERKDYGEVVFASWKRDGVPANTCLALVEFRKEHDHRAANLPKKPKQKHRRLMAKART